jgi:2-polyprenyl-6-methoxyphenol hydroxylase-like FAD-dependent oxidoreductase
VLAGRPDVEGASAHLVQQVRAVSGHELAGQEVLWRSGFQPHRMLAVSYYQHRVLLCGDAAHVMSPIGGQGMNTGFADAELLGELLADLRSRPAQAEHGLAVYDRVRRRAFKVASARAARAMFVGTRTGWVGSHLRAALIRWVLFHPRVMPGVAARFAMMTIPYRDRGHVPARLLPSSGSPV